MKKGELRRFSDELITETHGKRVQDRTFMILDVYPLKDRDGELVVNFLIDGRVEQGWGIDWVARNSEVLNETR